MQRMLQIIAFLRGEKLSKEQPTLCKAILLLELRGNMGISRL
nr:MAG TPA: hypothetical protein [Caudoviricetes sp.]